MDKVIRHELIKDWEQSGIYKGDIVLLHSSLSSLLRKLKRSFNVLVPPREILSSITDALGPKGTLILPLFNFQAFPEKQFFDFYKTPSQMGILTEIARKLPGAIRTGHPIYSFCAIGQYADAFQGIDNKNGYGSNSPFAKIKEMNGKIAIIGLSDQNAMTSYHFVEEQNEVHYRYHKDFIGLYVDKNGGKSQRTYSLFVRDLQRGIQTDVNRMMEHLWAVGAYQGHKPHEGYGMRTIDFNHFYQIVDAKIKAGEASKFLYSIQSE